MVFKKGHKINVGRKYSLERNRKISEANSGENHSNYGKHLGLAGEFKKGQHYSPSTEFKKREHASSETEYKKNDERLLGENNSNWKGDSVGYVSLHKWIAKYKPKSECCEFCSATDRKLELANISGEYYRDIHDFLYLRRECHRAFDK